MTYIGIDVSKDTLDISTPDKVFKTTNDKVGFNKILKIAKKYYNPCCVCESTGGNELNMAIFLSKAGISVCVENPTKIKFFREA